MHKIAPSFWHCSLPKGKATGGDLWSGWGRGGSLYFILNNIKE